MCISLLPFVMLILMLILISKFGMLIVRHKRHARMISDFLNITTADVEEYTVHHAKDDDKMTHPNIKVAVEGNISSGKSTFLQAVGQLSENLRSTTQFIPEPVEMWTDHNGIFWKNLR